MKEIIKVMDDGTQHKLEHGAVIEMQGDDINMSFVDIKPMDIVELVIGLVEAVRRMGLGEALEKAIDYYYGEKEDVDAGTEGL
ncbi:MAG: hypothetical protein HFJ09_14125 [Lachnospiraceae bacterium]|nr:hypothetical protein [Lachnospiraceae bacterium]